MGIAILTFILVIALASAAGWTADSRDSADWKPYVFGVLGGAMKACRRRVRAQVSNL
ncbi:hypothetical protein [Pseudonocardia acaciae]|uniref:hypothetical protein n=1 Tax=Pseudonocardia acaciae TaxID=551276 RepID=UPI0012EE2AFC|nr:hypothetical protein [Pseudonocardia acaciae]